VGSFDQSPDVPVGTITHERAIRDDGLGAFDELVDVVVGALVHKDAVRDGDVGAFDEFVDIAIGALTYERAIEAGVGSTGFGCAACETGRGCDEYETGGEELSGVLCVFHVSTLTRPGMNAGGRRYEDGMHSALGH
jgi:hypothetical protein